MNILEVYQDKAGNWRARVDIGRGVSVFLKFEKDKRPTVARILNKAQNIVDQIANQEARDAAKETRRLDLIADIEAFDENTISKNAAINLAKRLIKNYYKDGFTN